MGISSTAPGRFLTFPSALWQCRNVGNKAGVEVVQICGLDAWRAGRVGPSYANEILQKGPNWTYFLAYLRSKITVIRKEQVPRANRHHIPGQVWHITHRCHKKEFLLKFVRDRKIALACYVSVTRVARIEAHIASKGGLTAA